MQINLYTIAKKEKDTYGVLGDDFSKMINKFANFNDNFIFNKQIASSQTKSSQDAQRSYSTTFVPFLKKGYNIALDPQGKAMDSFAFAKLLEDRSIIQFYIGGAYGFEDSFLNQCDHRISLTPLTMSHKLAKMVLMEQIFRGLSINNNHPYHK